MERHRLNTLHYLVSNDHHLDRIHELLLEGIDLNLPDDFGNTLLHTAAHSFSTNNRVIRELISAGADVNFVNGIGYTPLHHAAVRRKREMVEALLQAGADVNAGTPSGNTALHYAINNAGFEFIRILCFRDHVPSIPDMLTIRMLLQHPNINPNPTGLHGETPLIWAIKDREVSIAKALLAKGANPNICDVYNESPLHIALGHPTPSIRIMYLLMRYGADLCCLNEDNYTPIDILINRIRDESLRFNKIFVRIMAFHYNVGRLVKKNLRKEYPLFHFLSECCNEVSLMRTQIISRNLTVHDYLLRCFNEDEFEDLTFQIYKPLVDILMTGVYHAYLKDILTRIGKCQLWKILRYNLLVKNVAEDFRHVENVDFLQLSLNCELSNYMTHWDLFQLILSYSNLTDIQIRAIYPL